MHIDCYMLGRGYAVSIMTKMELTILFIAEAVVFLIIAVALQMIYMR